MNLHSFNIYYQALRMVERYNLKSEVKHKLTLTDVVHNAVHWDFMFNLSYQSKSPTIIRVYGKNNEIQINSHKKFYEDEQGVKSFDSENHFPKSDWLGVISVCELKMILARYAEKDVDLERDFLNRFMDVHKAAHPI